MYFIFTFLSSQAENLHLPQMMLSQHKICDFQRNKKARFLYETQRDT